MLMTMLAAAALLFPYRPRGPRAAERKKRGPCPPSHVTIPKEKSSQGSVSAVETVDYQSSLSSSPFFSFGEFC